MKKVILILSIILMSININAQLMESPNITTEKHPFLLSYSAGFLGSSLAATGTYVLTKNKYVAYAVGVVAGAASGYFINKYYMSNGSEFSNRHVINGTYGAFTNIICFAVVIPSGKKKELIEF